MLEAVFYCLTHINKTKDVHRSTICPKNSVHSLIKHHILGLYAGVPHSRTLRTVIQPRPCLGQFAHNVTVARTVQDREKTLAGLNDH